MVIVDSCVWIDLLRGSKTPETIAFKRIAAEESIGLGDLILFEVLQGVRPEDRVEKIKSKMLVFPVFTMGGRDLALEAALYARVMRSQGVQVSTIDCMIAT